MVEMEKPEPIREYVFTAHAMFEMKRRGLAESIVRKVIEQPQQRHPVRPGREVFQSRVGMGGKTYLVRVFVDVDRSPAAVVTAYRTSRIDKYWRHES